MTKEQIKAKIDTLFFGCHATDVKENNALPEILGALLDAVTPVEVTDIQALTNEQLDALQVGDSVAKVTGNQKHLYLVTYKGEGTGEGICLSHNAAGYGETVSYDRTANGWAFNSIDIKTYGA